MIAIIGTSDRPCWLAEACKVLLQTYALTYVPIKTSCMRRQVRASAFSHIFEAQNVNALFIITYSLKGIIESCRDLLTCRAINCGRRHHDYCAR